MILYRRNLFTSFSFFLSLFLSTLSNTKSDSRISNGNKLVYRRSPKAEGREKEQRRSCVARYLKINDARLVYCQRCYARLRVSRSSPSPEVKFVCFSLFLSLSLLNSIRRPIALPSVYLRKKFCRANFVVIANAVCRQSRATDAI